MQYRFYKNQPLAHICQLITNKKREALVRVRIHSKLVSCYYSEYINGVNSTVEFLMQRLF